MKYAVPCSSIRRAAMLLGAACLLVCSARATLIAEEEFDYSTGPLAGQNGGSGWSGAWTPSGAGGTVSGPDIPFPVAFTGLKGDFVSNDNGDFRMPILSPDEPGSTLYISFLGRITNVGSGYAGLSLFQGDTEELFLGKPNGQIAWGFDLKGSGTQLSEVATTTLSLMVFRIDFGPTTTVRLYMNSIGSEPPLTDAIGTRTAFEWDTIRIQSGGGTSGAIDEIRIGDTFASVTPTVPEPSAIGALLGGSALLGVVRRRRSGGTDR